MSNYLAIATVTECLRQSLNDAAAAIVPGADATALKPNDSSLATKPSGRINCFLYLVTPNSAMRNRDFNNMSADKKTQSQYQATALDLHYLLSFYGPDATFVPQQLLGITAAHLHAFPQIKSDYIQKLATTAVAGSFLKKTNLQLEIETVKFTPVTATIEELSKFWTMFSQTPYALSMLYKASAVCIEADMSRQVKTVTQPAEILVSGHV